MKRLKAFTLIELLIAMVVGGIVIGGAFEVYLFSSRQFLKYKASNEEITRIVMLDGILHSDFFNSTSVVRKSDNCMEMKSSDKVIDYRFERNFVLRSFIGVSDTFFLKVSVVQMQFKGKLQLEGERLIDELEIISKEGDEEKVFCFFKEYSADVLMKQLNEQH